MISSILFGIVVAGVIWCLIKLNEWFEDIINKDD